MLEQGLELLGVVHHAVQATGRDLFELGGVETAFKQQQRLRYACGAQAQCLVETGNPETIGLGQGLAHAHRAVTIGVGLDHGEHTRTRGAGPGSLQVVPDRVEVDPGLAGACQVPLRLR